MSFCGHAINQDEPLIIPDTHEDERFADNPLVTEDPMIRFYAGFPLAGPGGLQEQPRGTGCVGEAQGGRSGQVLRV